MGCSMGHATAVRKEDMKERGYSTEQFVNDYLVPVDCFACTLPPESDDARAQSLAQELVDYSAACVDFYKKGEGKPKDGEGKPKVPGTAFCLFRLVAIDIDQTGGGTLDLNNGACKLGVRLRGGILVPGTADWLTRPGAPEADALRPAAPKHGEEPPMVLNVEVWGLIHRPQTQMRCLSDDSGVIVQAKQVVFKTVGNHGDAMVESWLPIEDFLMCMTVALTGKLKAALDDGVDEDDYT